MTHVRARMFDWYIRRLDVFGGDGADIPTLRARFERSAPKVPFWYAIRTSPAELGGVSAEWVETSRSARDQVLLYLHGGGWFMGSPRTHRSIVADLVRTAGIRGLTLDYRLAPEHPYPAALDDCAAAYEGLLASGIAPGSIVLGGDSSGGNLALALLLRLRDAGRPLPSGTVLLSPMTDLTMSGASHTTRKSLDPSFAKASIEPILERYIPAGQELGSYLSPLQADLRGLPPMLVHVGDHEVLRDDAVRCPSGGWERPGTPANIGNAVAHRSGCPLRRTPFVVKREAGLVSRDEKSPSGSATPAPPPKWIRMQPAARTRSHRPGLPWAHNRTRGGAASEPMVVEWSSNPSS